MEGAGSPKLLFENRDLTPIHPILRTGLHKEGPGRPVEYPSEWALKALMLRPLLQIPYVKDLVKRLRRNPYPRNACGYRDKATTEATRAWRLVMEYEVIILQNTVELNDGHIDHLRALTSGADQLPGGKD